ncbi:mucin-19 [Latimeria chalumnae]|uniref:mucin-19 n=1 Tax=Latimeria chalumnae TaxID=7897 RepID=UPI00313D3636
MRLSRLFVLWVVCLAKGDAQSLHVPQSIESITASFNSFGQTSTWGRGAYKPLNGTMYYFESACTFTFCRHCIDSGDFNIELSRDKKGLLKKIMILIDGVQVAVEGHKITVGEQVVRMPYNQKLLHIQKYGMNTRLISRRGILSLTWNNKDALWMTLHKKYETCGLCGDLNYIPENKVQSIISESNLEEHRSCRTNPPITKTPRAQNIEDITKTCKAITSQYFSRCFGSDELKHYTVMCTIEYAKCSNHSMSLCAVFSEMARKCADLKQCDTWEQWRTDSRIACDPPTCPTGQEYFECVTPYPPSCSNPIPEKPDECVASCVCKRGLILDDIRNNNTCILQKDCPCEHDGNIYEPGAKKKILCQECTCKGGTWDCSNKGCEGTCKIEEGSFIRTFDGTPYTLHGDCEFYAVVSKSWSIIAELRQCQDALKQTCLQSVSLTMKTVSKTRMIHINSSHICEPIVLYAQKPFAVTDITTTPAGEIEIYKKSSFYIQVNTIFGLKMKIQITHVMQLYITLSDETDVETKGLCGTYNDNAEDDFTSSQGIIEDTPGAFTSSWKVKTCRTPTAPTCIHLENEKFAEEHCQYLKDPKGVFAACHSVVDYRSYYENCKTATCICEDVKECLCTALGNYAMACAENGLIVRNWRRDICQVNCPSNQEFSYNNTACNSYCRLLSEYDFTCMSNDVPVDGCGCPSGTYMNSRGECVEKTNCECFFQNELLNSGDTKIVDGKTCLCQGGRVNCSDTITKDCKNGTIYVNCTGSLREVEKTCSNLNLPDRMDTCVPGCYCTNRLVRNEDGECVLPEKCPCSYHDQIFPAGAVIKNKCNNCTCSKGEWTCTKSDCTETCHVYGDGHYQTFDGLRYSFDGNCRYTFVEDYCNQGNGSFRITTEATPCCENGVACSRKIKILLKNKELLFNDGKLTMTHLNLSECENDTYSYSVHTVGLYMILNVNNGITLIWDKQTKVSVMLDPRWKGKVCGLCGNNNGNLFDEFTTRSNSRAGGPLEFGNSWKISPPECTDVVTQSFPCDANPYCRSWAQRKCSIIRKGAFEQCHSKVDPELYYKACVEEACVCDMEGKYIGFCTAVAAYAAACNEVGSCIRWRTPDLCPVFCDYYNEPGQCSWHYEPCGTLVSKTCSEHSLGKKFSSVLEGCYAKCPEDKPYLDENYMKCVSLSNCSCFYNKIVSAGETIIDDCGRECNCTDGRIICIEITTTTVTPTTTTEITSVTTPTEAITSTAVTTPPVTTSTGTATTSVSTPTVLETTAAVTSTTGTIS